MERTIKERVLNSINEVLPKAIKTALWIVRITTLITLAMLLLDYFNILKPLSELLAPLFNLIGLPGEAALAYVTGYFVNVYSAIAVISTLTLDGRSITILAVMILCSHNMITETAVQKKSGSSALRIGFIRTFSAFALAFLLNLIMPLSSEIIESSSIVRELSLLEMLEEWFFKTVRLILLMSSLIISLSILQRLLSEFGVIEWLSKIFKPLLALFGLPQKTSFLWIVANTLGLAYGAAIMIGESESGKISKEEVNLLNHHIAISHSNIEDLLLLASVGGAIWWMLLSRWFFSLLLVWELRLEMVIKKKIFNFVD